MIYKVSEVFKNEEIYEGMLLEVINDFFHILGVILRSDFLAILIIIMSLIGIIYFVLTIKKKKDKFENNVDKFMLPLWIFAIIYFSNRINWTYIHSILF
ncbi:hypothetical protein BTS2_3331 [Bacillus sp. TS-2]|nr:hypothetical protein BTS2_3331 [Bacillus sp. TS-2]